jgi:hypothetical protein
VANALKQARARTRGLNSARGPSRTADTANEKNRRRAYSADVIADASGALFVNA